MKGNGPDASTGRYLGISLRLLSEFIPSKQGSRRAAQTQRIEAMTEAEAVEAKGPLPVRGQSVIRGSDPLYDAKEAHVLAGPGGVDVENPGGSTGVDQGQIRVGLVESIRLFELKRSIKLARLDEIPGLLGTKGAMLFTFLENPDLHLAHRNPLGSLYVPF